MSKRESIARYNLIINRLRRRPSTFAEIENHLILESELQGYNFNVSKRTFQRDLDDIRSIYNIDIQYNFSQKVYFIEYDQQPEANERILEAFDVFNALNITDRLSVHIHFEKRKPQGTENLYGLLHAIKNQLMVKFTYEKFSHEEITERKVEPYALKEFRNRWYILANDLNDNEIKNFGLDRLTDLDITKKRFELPSGFDVNEHFKHCFGIIIPNEGKPQEVVLSFKPSQGNFIKTLPLHETQEILVDNADECRVRLKLFITHDFFMELLSMGNNLKVIKPTSLIKKIKSTYNNALKLYE